MSCPKDSQARLQLADQLERADDLLDEHVFRTRPAAARLRVLRSAFQPWWGQRMVLRSGAAWRVLVAARQVGKTFLSVHLVLQVALERPGSLSVLLVPTLRHARQPIALLRRFCEALPGCAWNATERQMRFANGSTFEVYSAEREGATRGPTITGLLWADEAALIPARAWNEVLPAAGHALKLLTTTPAGKNWVFDEFVSDEPAHESFRFRSADSPHVNHEEVARCRASMTPEFAAQEFEAEFVDSLILAFAHVEGLFVSQLPKRDPRAAATAMGIDLGKEQDWTVVTVLNTFGEGQVLARWRHQDWPTTTRRIVELIHDHGVQLVVVDKAQVGSYVADELRRIQNSREAPPGFPLQRVVAYETFSASKKELLVDTTRADVQWGRLKLLRNDLAEQLDFELRVFQGIKRVSQGREFVSYGCPQSRGLHDDCVISLCLANWGRQELLGDSPHAKKPVDWTGLMRLNRSLWAHAREWRI